MIAPTMAVPALDSATRSQRTAFAAVALGLLGLGLLFQAEIASAVRTWMDSTAYNHCFLVIPIAAYLIWDRRAVLRGLTPAPLPAVALAGLPVGLAWLLSERLGIMEGRQLAAMTFVELLFLVVLGWRYFWALSGPLLYLYFLVPFGEFLVPKLQDVTTLFTVWGLTLLHIPFYSDGYTFDIPEGSFVIAEACAGLRFLIASIAFGCLYALLMYRSPVRRILFIAASVVVPIIANGFRAVGIIALGHYLGSAQAAETDHVLYGWIFFSIVILLLTALGLPFRQDGEQHDQPDPGPTSRRLAIGTALAGAAAVAVVAAFGPAAAAQFDRMAAAVPEATLPAPPDGSRCVAQPVAAGEPGTPSVQHLVCGGLPVTLQVMLFNARTTSGPVLAEQRRLSGANAEDVATTWLPIPEPGAHVWRLVTTDKPARVAAVSMWIDGRPGAGGISMRVRQARNSVLGGGPAPIVVSITPDADWSNITVAQNQQLAQGLADLLQRETWLSSLPEALAASGAGR